MKLSHHIFSLLTIVLLFISSPVNSQDPPDLSLIFYLDENSPIGTLVGTVNATDPDGDPLTFSIVSGNESGAFGIGASSGDLTVNDESQLDFESTPSFNLMVEADDGNGGMTTAAITINLNDIDENVLATLEDLSIHVFPNPVANSLFIDFPDQSFRLVELVSSSGRVVLSQHVPGRITELQIANLRSGMYFVRFTSLEGIVLQKRVVKL